MAKNKKNKKQQTFNVYPYLGGYQHFMRTGGQLPKFEEAGAVVNPNVIQKRMPYNKYSGLRTYEQNQFIPHGSTLGRFANLVDGAIDFGKTVGGVFNKANWQPGGRYSKYEKPILNADGTYTGGLKYGRMNFTNTTDQNAVLHGDNLLKYMNMSNKEKKDWIESGGRNTDLWWTPDEMRYGKFNYMDLNEDGTPRFDGINLRASTLRGDILEKQTGDRMFSNKTKVLQPDGTYKFVYFDNKGNMLMNQDGTPYDKIEETTGTGGLADANVSNLNIQYEVDVDGNPINPTNNQAVSFDHFVEQKGSDGTVENVEVKNVEYDPTKDYGNYESKQVDEGTTQARIDCETGATCGGSPGRWTGSQCICPGDENYRFGGALPKYQTKGEIKAYSKALNLNKRDTRSLLNELTNQGMNLQTDTIIGAQGDNRQHVVDNLIDNIDQYPPYWNQFSPLNMYAPELRQYPNIFSSRQAYVALPKLEEGDETEEELVTPDPYADMVPLEIDTSKNSFNNPLAPPPAPPSYTVDPMNNIPVADESQNSPSPNVPVISKEALTQQAYDEAGLDNPNVPRTAATEDQQNMGIDVNYGDNFAQKATNKIKEATNTGVGGALMDTLVGRAGQETCTCSVKKDDGSDYASKEECEKNGGTYDCKQSKGTGLMSFLFEDVIPIAKDIIGQNQRHKDKLFKTSVSAEDMFAAAESGVGSGQRGFYDVNKGGYGDDLYGTGKIFGQLAQDGMEMMPQQEPRDYAEALGYKGDDIMLRYNLNMLKDQKAYLGKMKFGGNLPRFQTTGETPPKDYVDASSLPIGTSDVASTSEYHAQTQNINDQHTFGDTFTERMRIANAKGTDIAMIGDGTDIKNVNLHSADDISAMEERYGMTLQDMLDSGKWTVSEDGNTLINTPYISTAYSTSTNQPVKKNWFGRLLSKDDYKKDNLMTFDESFGTFHLPNAENNYQGAFSTSVTSDDKVTYDETKETYWDKIGQYSIDKDGQPGVDNIYSNPNSGIILPEVTVTGRYGYEMPSFLKGGGTGSEGAVLCDAYDKPIDPPNAASKADYSAPNILDTAGMNPGGAECAIPGTCPGMRWGGALPKANDGTESKPWYSKAADYVQTGLTGVGLTPGPVGFVADAINTGISGTRTVYNTAIGDDESAKIHAENTVTNALSSVPGPTGWAAGGASLTKDIAGYTNVYDSDTSITTKIAEGVKDKKPVTITENLNVDKKIGDADKAKLGKEIAEVDMALYYELLRAGADIEIIR